MGERRLGDEAGIGGGGERAVVGHREGVAELVQFHRPNYGTQRTSVLDGRSRAWWAGIVPWIAIVVVGAVVGFLGGLFGKGGSAIATPLLAAAGVPPIIAVASPLPATVPGTSSPTSATAAGVR